MKHYISILLIVFGHTVLHAMELHKTLDKALLAASMQGNVNEIRNCIGKGANVNAQDAITGTTPLHHIAHNCRLKDTAKLLLDNGAKVNIKDNAGMTPLHCASFEGCEATIRLLLEQGADVKILNNQGNVPVDLAYLTRARRAFEDYRELQKIQEEETEGKTLHWAKALNDAIKNGYKSLVAYLLSKPIWSQATLLHSLKEAKIAYTQELSKMAVANLLEPDDSMTEAYKEIGAMLRKYVGLYGPEYRISKTGLDIALFSEEIRKHIASMQFKR